MNKDEEKKFIELIDQLGVRLKRLLINIIKIEDKIERNNKDIWEYMSELSKRVEESKIEPRH